MTTSTNVERRRLRTRRALFVISTALCTGLVPGFARPAAAQLAAPAPVRESIDANGVDLFFGTMNVDAPALTIGGSQGISYYKLSRGAGWSDSLTASLNSAGSLYIVAIGGNTDSFTLSGGTYTPTEGNGATLTYNSTTKIYTYTSRNGTVAHFDKNKAMATPYYASEGVVTDITSPAGEKLTFGYGSIHYCAQKNFSGLACVRWADAYRIGSVRNAYGYRITLNYEDYPWDPNDLDLGDPDFNVWSTPIGVTATNLAVSGGPTPSQTFTMSESGSTSYLTVTDPMSRATVYRAVNSRVAGIKLPGSSSEDVTVTYSSFKVSSITTPVGTYGYTYSDASGVRTVTVTDPASKVTTYTFDIASSRMTSMTDARAGRQAGNMIRAAASRAPLRRKAITRSLPMMGAAT